MKISQRIRAGLQEGEDILTSLLGLIIAISGLIAFADVFSSGKALAFLPWLLWVWIIAQAIAVDYMFYIAVKRQFTASGVDRFVYWTRWVLIVILGALVVFVGAIFATNETQGGAISASMAVLGIPSIAFMYGRAAAPVLLLFVIGIDHALEHKEQPAPVQATAAAPDMDTLIERLDTLYSKRLEVLLEKTVERVTISLEQQQTAPRLPVVTNETLALPEPETPRVTWNSLGKVETVQFPGKAPVQVHGEVSSVDTDIEQQIRAILAEDNTLSARAIAQRVGCSPTTASKWKSRIEQQEQEQAKEA